MNSRALLAMVMVAACTPTTGLAEVSTDFDESDTRTLIIESITDGPDPIGIWIQYRSIPTNRVLNPGGAARGDGRPDIAYPEIVDDPDPVGRPAAVWAYNTGIDHDIAFSEWSGESWGVTEFLTADTEDDVDPRIFAGPDGDLHAVWWKADVVERVYWSTRPADDWSWTPPVEVVSGGRRPSVAVFEGTLRIAYERDSVVAGMAQDVVVLRREPSGSFTEEFVASTTRVAPLDAVLHATAVKLWLDWKHTGQVFGCAERGPAAWGGVAFVSWPDPSWLGVEEVRKVVQRLVLDP